MKPAVPAGVPAGRQVADDSDPSQQGLKLDGRILLLDFTPHADDSDPSQQGLKLRIERPAVGDGLADDSDPSQQGLKQMLHDDHLDGVLADDSDPSQQGVKSVP